MRSQFTKKTVKYKSSVTKARKQRNSKYLTVRIKQNQWQSKITLTGQFSETAQASSKNFSATFGWSVQKPCAKMAETPTHTKGFSISRSLCFFRVYTFSLYIDDDYYTDFMATTTREFNMNFIWGVGLHSDRISISFRPHLINLSPLSPQIMHQ